MTLRAAVGAALCALVVAAGCGGDGDDPAAGPELTPDAEATASTAPPTFEGDPDSEFCQRSREAAEEPVLDPFEAGRLLDREEAFKRIEQIAGGSVIRDDTLLRPATHVEWICRLIQNLVSAFDRLGRQDDMAAMLELRGLVSASR